MTSEIESMKTNEFLRRRKLRLQQVREQSKDIAKKIRQRANVEKLRQTIDLDGKKQKEYFDKQEKLVKRLEVLYAKGLENVGVSHRSATEVKQQENFAKIDLSKSRAKEAAIELRRQKQEKLDNQKRLLDRKLQAREAANELSREKSSNVAHKLSKASVTKDIQKTDIVVDNANTKEKEALTDQEKENLQTVSRTDMATQWDFEEQPNEWEPAIPTLSLPKDDRDSLKESDTKLIDSLSDKSRKLDLFALSKEMPSSLRGGNINIPSERVPVKPSLTLVSEYLQNRGLRLRESDTIHSKKSSDDLRSLKQTIQRTRPSKAEGSVCHVLDGQVIPVPTWQAEAVLDSKKKVRHTVRCRELNSVTNSEINKIFSSIRPVKLLPSPVLRGSSPFRRSKFQPFIAGKNISEKSRSNSQDSALPRKSSVTMYNHSTRNTHDVNYNDDKLVVRDSQPEEDAYSQAMKEMSAENMRDKDHRKKIQDMRNKVAMTKQSVEKEYKDTISFLNSIPKEKCSKAVKHAYMDDRRQQMVNERRQQKLQHEYREIEKDREIEKECSRHHHCNESRSKSKSPTKANIDNEFEKRDFQYSWMPVPEGDGSLAIHTIPTSLKEPKPGNTVKFSKVDSYHEYRSRHKHTPPTKDTTSHEKRASKRIVETVTSDKDSDTTDNSSSDTSSVQNLGLVTKKRQKNKQKERDNNMSDAERIIIYKILDSRSDKKSKKSSKVLDDIARSLTSIEKEQANDDNAVQMKLGNKNVSKETENRVSFEQLNEGVYKMVNEKGNNINSMYFDKQLERDVRQDAVRSEESCSCKKPNKEQQDRSTNVLNWECGEVQQARSVSVSSKIVNTCKHKETTVDSPSAHTSATSFKTVTSEKPNVLTEDGFIKLLDEAGQDAGKFYIGATGFLKDDDYEMVIQLRKKGGKDEKNADNVEPIGAKAIEKNVVQPASHAKDLHKSVDSDIKDALSETNLVDTVKSAPQTNAVDNNIQPKETTAENMNENKEPIISNNLFIPECNNLVDKGVGTSFQLSYAVSDDVPKVDPVPRPATSTCTQTTLTSPNHRPVLFHMSSSTSTAYMSPPEMVLPKFLRRDFYMPEDDVAYEPVQRVEVTQKQNFCQLYSDCNCKRCSRTKKFPLKENAPACYRKKEYDNGILNTPHNTARSCTSEHTVNVPTHKHRTGTIRESPVANKTTCKCNKCENKVRPRTCTKTDTQKCNRKANGTKRTNRNIYTHSSTSNTPRSKCRTSSDRTMKSSTLNPVIKNYVNKLLDLNREGLKVIEVVDQECSSVATPNSSIINVPHNVDEKKCSLEKKISLEQIKHTLKKQIIAENLQRMQNNTEESSMCAKNSNKKVSKVTVLRKPRLKPVHKVKSLNISKHLLKAKTSEEVRKVVNKPVSTSTTDDNTKPRSPQRTIPNKTKSRSKSSPTPRQVYTSESASRLTDIDASTSRNIARSQKLSDKKINASKKYAVTVNKQLDPHMNSIFRSHRATLTSTSPESESTGMLPKYKPEISTQTSQNIDSEISFMKLAEDKLQNMEKIADLTEKCTQRLSNLAKVLEEVRKNKSLAYSQISTSDTTSDSDQKSDKIVITPVPFNINDNHVKVAEIVPATQETGTDTETIDANLDYTPFLTDLPKPTSLKVPNSSILQSSKSVERLNLPTDMNTEIALKIRPKPPPALSRIHMKHGQELIVPHELSTVLEVDSPMSVKHKNHSSRNGIKSDSPINMSEVSDDVDRSQQKGLEKDNDNRSQETYRNPDLLQSNIKARIKQQLKSSSTESSDSSKLQMIDLKHFNDIMLEPFISIQEYAKQYNVETLDEGSNLEEVQKDDASSLHSDGSLPDVIAELLKRNIIAEPFKFDTPSNMNSTTISSESTLSVLALSKVRNEKKRSNVMFKNKENIAETSDSLSISSNPDLENAFKKLGMGWASSTLKKTKERLALSSSSNTSGSSVSQVKIKHYNPDVPALVSDSVSSALNSSKKEASKQKSRNVEQQTSLVNSMTVKEFLTNKLANKITFTNKSNRNDTEEEFVSLFETKMPEEMKEDNSASSMPSNNRARTSTPVQIFKSMTYHSSSSSNVSNGLFSNADDISSVKMTSNSMKNHSTSEKDDLTVPNISLRLKKSSDCSKSD